MDVRTILEVSERTIDSSFGAGYAKNNPVLLAAFVHAMALGEIAAALERMGCLERLAVDLPEAINNLAGAVEHL